MRIGITCYPTYGGSGIVATELGLELAARGHDVHFISYANPIRLDPGIPRIHYHEVEVSNYLLDGSSRAHEFSLLGRLAASVPFRKLGIPERGRVARFDGPHRIDGTESYPFLDRWLDWQP